MTPDNRQEALAHAEREAPREACGLLVIASGQELYIPCRNIAEQEQDFAIDPEDYAKAEDLGDIVGIVHSHPNSSAKPSQADLVSCEASGLPWYIVSIPGGVWEELRPSGYKAPYIGRKFVHGVCDCYSLARDWYRDELGVLMSDYDRSYEWWNKGQNLYVENFRREGFEVVPHGQALQRGDLILMQIRSKVPNHAAVYLGSDRILHHLQGRLSCTEIYGGYYRKNTILVIRYQGKK